MAAKRTGEGRAAPGAEANVPRSGATSFTAAGTTSRAVTAWRAGRHPFSPGPSRQTGECADLTDLQQTLYVKIVQEWVQTLTGPFDWANWPLDRYVFSETFHQHLKRQKDLDNAAWVCAMVACGLAHEFCELELKPRPAGPGGRPVREDGAEGYRCTIVSGRGAGSRLDFWRLPSGVIEFATFTAIRLVCPPTITESEQAAC
ncbi:MAG TPA: hypothetical protein VGL57_14805 [Solirubrobacteraceae bacterium]|jgi:hypothetical protein